MENKVKYKVEFSMVAGPVNIWGKVDSYINSNSIKSRKIVFVFPKEIKPEFLLVNNKIVPIEYTD